MKEGSTLPEHMRRMMRKLGADFIRLVPARSAPVYEHQLHKNPTIRGSKFLLFVFNFAASLRLNAPDVSRRMPKNLCDRCHSEPFAVILSPFASLRVNSAKDLALSAQGKLREESRSGLPSTKQGKIPRFARNDRWSVWRSKIAATPRLHAEDALQFRIDLLVGEAGAGDRARRAGGHAGATAFAQWHVDPRNVLFLDIINRLVGAQGIADAAAAAIQLVDLGPHRIDFDRPFGDGSQHAGRRRAGLGHRVRNVLWSLRTPGHKEAVRGGGHRVQLRMTLQEETIRAAAEAEKPPDLLSVPARLYGIAEHHHIDRDLAEPADQRVLATDQQCTFVTLRPARLDHLGNLPTNDVGAFVQD